MKNFQITPTLYRRPHVSLKELHFKLKGIGFFDLSLTLDIGNLFIQLVSPTLGKLFQKSGGAEAPLAPTLSTPLLSSMANNYFAN